MKKKKKQSKAKTKLKLKPSKLSKAVILKKSAKKQSSKIAKKTNTKKAKSKVAKKNFETKLKATSTMKSAVELLSQKKKELTVTKPKAPLMSEAQDETMYDDFDAPMTDDSTFSDRMDTDDFREISSSIGSKDIFREEE